jgi:hypothetical protein
MARVLLDKIDDRLRDAAADGIFQALDPDFPDGSAVG